MKINTKFCVLALTLILTGLIFPSLTIVSAQYPGGYTFVNLTMNTNVSGGGVVTPYSGQCYYGQIVTCREQPNPGYVFDGWYVNGVPYGNQSIIQLTMLQDYTVTATFSIRTVALTIAVNPSTGGTTTPAPGVNSSYLCGQSVRVTETPQNGYTFSGWYLDGLYIGAGTSAMVIMNQDHQLNAFFSTGSGDTTILPGPTATPIPGMVNQIINSSKPVLQFYCTSSASTNAFNVRIQGSLSSNGTNNAIVLPNQPIQLQYSITGGASWIDLAYVTTDDAGNFTAFWMPSASGNYVIRALWVGNWVGNQYFSSVTTTANFVIAPPDNQDQTMFSVISNSTITSFNYNAATTQITFGVSGPDGSTGYVQVCVPKSALPDPTVMKVALDGSTVQSTYLSSGNVWLIIFVYHHSSHSVVMTLNPLAATLTPTPTSNPTSSSSPSQTTNPTNSVTPSSTEQITPTPSLPEFQSFAIIALIVALVSLTLLVTVKKHIKSKS